MPDPANGTKKYFIIKSPVEENIVLAIAKGVWATTYKNTQALEKSFFRTDHVVLLYYSKATKSYYGYAKMLSETDPYLMAGLWGEEVAAILGANFRVHWLKMAKLDGSVAD